jgi:hypothetical protein
MAVVFWFRETVSWREVQGGVTYGLDPRAGPRGQGLTGSTCQSRDQMRCHRCEKGH